MPLPGGSEESNEGGAPGIATRKKVPLDDKPVSIHKQDPSFSLEAHNRISPPDIESSRLRDHCCGPQRARKKEPLVDEP